MLLQTIFNYNTYNLIFFDFIMAKSSIAESILIGFTVSFWIDNNDKSVSLFWPIAVRR